MALVVDDDQDMCWVLETALACVGCAATTVSTAQDALNLIAKRIFPIAFVDARLPDMDGLRLSAELRDAQPGMRIIMISGYFLSDDKEISDAMRASKIDGFLAKPFQIESVFAAAANGKCRP